MRKFTSGPSRRRFLETGAAVAAASTLPLGAVHAQGAKYIRYNATSPEGQAMLVGYDKAIQKMLTLPASHPHNWFRNAFIHTLDCPHGNWWFFVWHRPYIGWFEQTVRMYSGNPNFAFPYWDWTQTPTIPNTMFKGALTPNSQYYAPYIPDLPTFRKFIGNTLDFYWTNAPQSEQLVIRGMPDQPALWSQVTGNPMFADNQHARWITQDKPGLQPDVAKMCALPTIMDGLAPTTFIPFNSQMSPSHNSPPVRGGFGILEGLPHNNVHNNVGGAVTGVPPADFGFMQDNLSPVDPLFFLHHSNMERLWDVWTRKQQAMKLPTLPTDPTELAKWQNEPFLFYINSKGLPVAENKAGDYETVGQFNYTYQPGSGDQYIHAPRIAAINAMFAGTTAGSSGTVPVSGALAQALAANSKHTVVAQVTVPHPGANGPRSYDITVNAPPGAPTGPNSPYYVATIAFFGNMPNMPMQSTFTVPLTRLRTSLAGKIGNALHFQVGAQGQALTAAPKLGAVSVQVW